VSAQITTYRKAHPREQNIVLDVYQATIVVAVMDSTVELGGTQDHSQGSSRMLHELSGCPHAALTYGGVSW